MGPFQVFDPDQAPTGRGVPVVYVLSAGRLILNAAAARRFDGATHVQLLWDADTKRLGIRPAEAADPGALKITAGASQATITSRAFVEAHPMPYRKRMRLELEGDMWVAATEATEP